MKDYTHYVTLCDCVFQYALGSGEIIMNTEAISRVQGDALVEEHKQRFRDDVLAGREPEMALWINMPDAETFGETSIHWNHADFIVRGRDMYQKIDL